MFNHLVTHRPPVVSARATRTHRWAIGVAAVPLLAGALGSTWPSAPADSGLAGCTTVSRAYRVAAADYPKAAAQFASSRWPDLRHSGLAYVEIATSLLTRHDYGGETAWFYQRLSAACAKHGRPLPI
jgi:hypothetical protein